VCFEQAGELDESPEALDGLSQALHFQGEFDRAIELKERAFASTDAVASGRSGRPGALAGVSAGVCAWQLGRGERLDGESREPLDAAEECVAHGWLTLDRAPFSRDSAEREQLARPVAIAKRFGDAGLEFDALALLGGVRGIGRVAEGMVLLPLGRIARERGAVQSQPPMRDAFLRRVEEARGSRHPAAPHGQVAMHTHLQKRQPARQVGRFGPLATASVLGERALS